MNTCIDPNARLHDDKLHDSRLHDGKLHDSAFPFNLNWNADQLTAAVPLRLHQIYEIDHLDATARQPSANQIIPPHRPRPTSYLPANPSPGLLRVR